MKTLILSGFGTNCERETRYACERAGASMGAGPVHVRHISEIYAGGIALDEYGFLVLIGGFMDGDDLGAGRACANRFRYRRLPAGMGGGTFLERLQDFIGSGRLLLGICNGFQVLAKLGILPGNEVPGSAYRPVRDAAIQTVSLTNNARGRFEDRWIHLRADPASPCVFTKGLEHLQLPVRHGEGRIAGQDGARLAELVEGHRTPLRYSLADGTPTEEYPANPNGSPYGIASLCNDTGTVLGLMPHPEAFNHYTNHPQWTRRPAPPDLRHEDGDGLALFRNAYAYLAAEGYTD
ncbi:MAG: phosphoribosylformylglycinamidine synthase subunit PurQ [SAR324 cluster bacterium]